MNFKKIIKEQLLLDEAIKKAHSIDQEDEKKMVIALYTEVGEFANEVQSFKYWKKNKNIDEDKLLEEYADGLHFLMSFAIRAKCSEIIKPLILSNDVNYQFLKMFNSIDKLSKKLNKRRVEKSIAIYLGLAQILEIDDAKIEKAYMLKNKKNFERIKNNY